MTLEQLRIFIAVAQRQHVTRAAEVLNLTQSAVSAAVQALEARHDTRLFDRVGRRIALTDAGRIFLDEAKAVLARAAAAETALAELGGMARGTLSLHASQTIAGYWLPRYLANFHEAYPKVDIKLAIGNTAHVAKSVVEGEAEIGFVEGHIDEDALSSRVVARDRMVVVVGPSHPWAAAGHVALDQLLAAGWVLREPGSGTRSEFTAALAGFGLDLRQLKVEMELPSNEAVRTAVMAGAGATAISELVVTAGIRAGLLVRIDLALPPRPFHVLHHRSRCRSKAGEALLAMIAADQEAER